MVVRTIRNETDPTFAVVSGTWANSSLWGSLPSGAGVLKSATSGTYRCTLPANHGYFFGVLIGYGTGTATTNAQVSVDGGVPQTWNQRFGSSADTHYNLPRILSFPFVLNPAKPGGATQTIDLIAGADGAPTYIDGIELYIPASPVAGRLTSFGHSMLYGVTDSNTLGPRSSTRFTKLLADYLAATQYLGVASWTDDNQGVPSEDLTNGGTNSGLAGGVNTSVLYAQFANSAYHSNGAIPTPGWMRAEAGDLWPATHAPRLDALSLMTTDAQYMVGVPQWWARAFQYGIFWPTVNDQGYAALYDDPLANHPGDSAEPQSPLKQVQVLHPSAALSAGDFTITGATFAGATVTSVTISVFTSVANLNTILLAAGIDYTASGATGSPLNAGTDITFTANHYKAQPISLSRTIGTPLAGGTLTMNAASPAGRDAIAAGVGYAAARHTQRVREALIRVALAIAPCPRVALVGYPNVQNGDSMNNAITIGTYAQGVYQSYDQGMRSILDEPWIAAVTGGAPFYFVSPISAMSGHASNVSSADSHPNDVGHRDIFDEIVRRHRRLDPNFVLAGVI